MNGTALKWILLITMFVAAVAVSLMAFFPGETGDEGDERGRGESVADGEEE